MKYGTGTIFPGSCCFFIVYSPTPWIFVLPSSCPHLFHTDSVSGNSFSTKSVFVAPTVTFPHNNFSRSWIKYLGGWSFCVYCLCAFLLVHLFPNVLAMANSFGGLLIPLFLSCCRSLFSQCTPQVILEVLPVNFCCGIISLTFSSPGFISLFPLRNTLSRGCCFPCKRGICIYGVLIFFCLT